MSFFVFWGESPKEKAGWEEIWEQCCQHRGQPVELGYLLHTKLGVGSLLNQSLSM